MCIRDRGIITPQVNALRESFGLPRMAVLQFGFGDAGSRIYLPHKCAADTVIYTGTHDTDTVKGWWAQLSEYERRNAETYLGPATDGIHWGMVRAAMTSPACLAVAPIQDVLGLGSEARMNIPSQPEGNWTWRVAPGSLTSEVSGRLAHLVEVTDREPKAIANGAAEEFVA